MEGGGWRSATSDFCLLSLRSALCFLTHCLLPPEMGFEQGGDPAGDFVGVGGADGGVAAELAGLLGHLVEGAAVVGFLDPQGVEQVQPSEVRQRRFACRKLTIQLWLN